MLKIYRVYNYVSIDGGKWRRVVNGWLKPTERKVTEESLETQHILCDASFDDAYNYLHNNRLDGVWDGSSVWGKTIFPVIKVRYNDGYDDVKYRKFNTMSYKTEYEEWKDVTLKWIMENLSADVAIQYLKERGMTACPILK